MNVKLASAVAKKFGQNGNPNASGFSLANQDPHDGTWRKVSDGSVFDGTFTYVRMNNGELRLGEMKNGVNAHASLAGNAMTVQYAGTVCFEQGRIKRFDNASGTYVPPANLRTQARFGTAAGFVAVHQPFVAQSAADKAAAIAAAKDAIRRRPQDGDTA